MEFNLLNNNGVDTWATPVFGLDSNATVANISDFTLGNNLLNNNGLNTWATPVFGLDSNETVANISDSAPVSKYWC